MTLGPFDPRPGVLLPGQVNQLAGGVPLGNVPPAYQARALRQIEKTQKCPNGCEPSWTQFVVAIPAPDGHNETRNAQARCMICLLYWEVTPDARLVRGLQPRQEKVTPGSRLPSPVELTGPAGPPSKDGA